jgi:hypothetical protein
MTREQAIKLAESKFWENMELKDIAKFQLFEEKLCMPFGVFHNAIEKTLDRPVFTHEFGLNVEGLKKELLKEKPMPTIEEIINLIPKDKQIIFLI